MNKKWITIPLALLSILSVGAPALTVNARRRPRRISRHYRRRYHRRHHETTNDYVRKNISFYNNGNIMRIHGRVKPIQLAHFMRTYYRNPTEGLMNSIGRVMCITPSWTSWHPVWHYETIQVHHSRSKVLNVNTGKYMAQNYHTNWVTPDNKMPVHMRTVMKRGYYYIVGSHDAAYLQFLYHGKRVGYSQHNLAFDMPYQSNSHYHGVEHQFIANLRKYKTLPPDGYVLKNNNHKAYQIHVRRTKAASHFPEPVAYVVKAPIPIRYNENGKLVSAGRNISNVTRSNLHSKLKGLNLRAPANGFTAMPSKASLVISKAGNEYVDIPSYKLGRPIKKVVHVTPSTKLHWVKANHQCQLYLGMSKNGTLYHPIKTIRPGYNDTFHLSKIIILHARNGHTFGRYQIRYNGRTYYSTTLPYYMGNSYYQPSEIGHAHKIKVILPVGEYKSHVYKKDTLIRYVHKGNVLNIKRIMPIGEDFQYRFILNNGRYVTANKNFVKLI